MSSDTTTDTTTWSRENGVRAKRDVWQAIKRGLMCRCPNCGEGKLFKAFLKVNDECPKCHEDLSHHRADDLPAYLVIVIVGHIVVPLALSIETNFSPPVLLQLAIYLPVTLFASLALLQPVKGAVVGLQWAFRMHGFEEHGFEEHGFKEHGFDGDDKISNHSLDEQTIKNNAL